MKNLAARLKEPSTWAAFGAMVGLAGVELPGEFADMGAKAFTAGAGFVMLLAGILRGEQSK